MSSSPSTIPFKFRRKSSSASTSVSLDDYIHSLEAAASSSPLPSSSPPLTPAHGTRDYNYAQLERPKYVDDVMGFPYDREEDFGDATLPWSCDEQDQKVSAVSHPFPSLMTKFAAQALRNPSSPSFPSPLYAACRTTSYFYPDGESALADDCEEYDLESMDIHVRETYFATSSERGRWLSSPIATRVRTEPFPPRHGQSSPVKTIKATAMDASPSAARVRRRIASHLADKERSTSLSSEDHDEEVRFSSPLPPSSPPTSPRSTSSLLLDDWEDKKIAESCVPSSDPNPCPSIGVSDSKFPLFTPTSPVGSTCPGFEAPDIVPGFNRPRFTHVSRSASPCQDHVPTSIGAQLDGDCRGSPTDATGSKLDVSSSPLTVFDDLPPAEPVMPLSDSPHSPETATPSRKTPPAPSSLVDVKHETSDAIGEPGPSGVAKKRKEPGTSHPEVPPKKKKKRAIVQLEATVCVLREQEQERRALAKGKGKECHHSDVSEPLKKKPKRASSPSNGCRTKPLQKRKTSDTSEPHSQPPAEVDSAIPAPPDGTAVGPPLTSESSMLPNPLDPAEAELHASLTGMLIEALATSRATSMDCGVLYLAITQSHPHLATERPKREFQKLISTVLESGRARCGMFGKVDSSGEASRHKALESRWFYVPDQDEDRERASLISAIMPRQKRSETKKYKQYYYRPLDKISRWDPEDAP